MNDERQDPLFKSAVSCAASACHGSIVEDSDLKLSAGIRRDEYFIWADSDPHANAHRVLGNAVSQRMVAYLVGDSAQPADYRRIYKRCLECHDTTSSPQPTELVSESYFELHHEGVGCESCHGPSRDWVDLHYQPEWPQADKESFGMRLTEPLPNRAELCGRCHVGGGPRDVDHDLIAAGHPQMKFEYSSYHTALPKHWRERSNLKPAEFEQRLYETGQRAAMQARLTLLKERAERADVARRNGLEAAWPEFSEFDCFACHHDLGDNGRRDRGFALENEHGFQTDGIGAKRVTLPWGVWHFSVAPTLTRSDFAQAYDDLSSKMQRITVSPRTAVKSAEHALDALAASSEHIFPPTDAEYLAAAREAVRTNAVVQTWDHAVQWYCLLAAMDRRQPPDESRRDELIALQRLLGFGVEYNSPREFFLPMSDNNRDAVKQQFQEVLESFE